jgi:hypothetical protein
LYRAFPECAGTDWTFVHPEPDQHEEKQHAGDHLQWGWECLRLYFK